MLSPLAHFLPVIHTDDTERVDMECEKTEALERKIFSPSRFLVIRPKNQPATFVWRSGELDPNKMVVKVSAPKMPKRTIKVVVPHKLSSVTLHEEFMEEDRRFKFALGLFIDEPVMYYKLIDIMSGAFGDKNYMRDCVTGKTCFYDGSNRQHREWLERKYNHGRVVSIAYTGDAKCGPRDSDLVWMRLLPKPTKHDVKLPTYWCDGRPPLHAASASSDADHKICYAKGITSDQYLAGRFLQEGLKLRGMASHTASLVCGLFWDQAKAGEFNAKESWYCVTEQINHVRRFVADWAASIHS